MCNDEYVLQRKLSIENRAIEKQAVLDSIQKGINEWESLDKEDLIMEMLAEKSLSELRNFARDQKLI